jgi:hypothetical protein
MCCRHCCHTTNSSIPGKTTADLLSPNQIAKIRVPELDRYSHLSQLPSTSQKTEQQSRPQQLQRTRVYYNSTYSEQVGRQSQPPRLDSQTTRPHSTPRVNSHEPSITYQSRPTRPPQSRRSEEQTTSSKADRTHALPICVLQDSSCLQASADAVQLSNNKVGSATDCTRTLEMSATQGSSCHKLSPNVDEPQHDERSDTSAHFLGMAWPPLPHQ